MLVSLAAEFENELYEIWVILIHAWLYGELSGAFIEAAACVVRAIKITAFCISVQRIQVAPATDLNQYQTNTVRA
jgi:hypothetical protein